MASDVENKTRVKIKSEMLRRMAMSSVEGQESLFSLPSPKARDALIQYLNIKKAERDG